MELIKVSETSTSITFRWTPVVCIGYVFYVNGKRVSNTWDSSVKQIRFNKVSGAVYRVEAIGVNDKGEYPKVITPKDPSAYNVDSYGELVYSF